MSSAELITAYLRQRVHARVFVPFVLVMTGAGWLLAPSAGFAAISMFSQRVNSMGF